MSRINGVERKEARQHRPTGELVVDQFKAFRQITSQLMEWYEKGVDTTAEYELDVMDLPAEDEIELKRYLRADPGRSEGSLTQDFYVRLRDRAHRLGMLHHKVKVTREGTVITLMPSSGEKRRGVRWKYQKVS